MSMQLQHVTMSYCLLFVDLAGVLGGVLAGAPELPQRRHSIASSITREQTNLTLHILNHFKKKYFVTFVRSLDTTKRNAFENKMSINMNLLGRTKQHISLILRKILHPTPPNTINQHIKTQASKPDLLRLIGARFATQ